MGAPSHRRAAAPSVIVTPYTNVRGEIDTPALLLLGRKRPREVDAALDPALELAFGGDALGLDPQPAVHGLAAHLKRAGVRLGQQRLGLLGRYPEQQSAATAGAHRHVASDEKGQAPEHLLLHHSGLAGD